MIADTDRLSVDWYDIRSIVVDAQGISIDQMRYYMRLMKDGGHCAPPLISHAQNGKYYLRDGRHRFLAHVALNRDQIRCILVRPSGD